MQLGVEVGADQVHVLQQLSQPLQGVVLALDRDDHLGAGHQGVDGEQAEGRRAVDEDVVERLLVGGDGALEPAFLDDEGPSADIPPFITTTNARELYDLRHGETVAQAAARKASEG